MAKTVDHRPQTKAREYLVAILGGGLEHLKDISLWLTGQTKQLIRLLGL
jgi:hypothetical protein